MRNRVPFGKQPINWLLKPSAACPIDVATDTDNPVLPIRDNGMRYIGMAKYGGGLTE